ncbi:hypothetical protein NPIL_341381 [Nephila pilipes]|uniref:Uncharacterized protein n=1 Tax=Nephila pilipes TaxID=299642 RepID=A0A8X6NKF2_NEPPI|nr:hypothetical protein NPIL_341381 [Nephila pilipes]
MAGYQNELFAEEDSKYDPLLEAVRINNLDKTKQLLAEGADVSKMGIVKDNNCGYNEYTPLMLAAEKGYLDMVKMLLEISNIDVNQKDYYGITALHKASCEGHSEVVKELLNVKGIDINIGCRKYGITPLHNASETETVKALLESRFILINKKDNSGKTALHHAAAGGRIEFVKILLKMPGISINNKCQQSFSWKNWDPCSLDRLCVECFDELRKTNNSSRHHLDFN